jgi:hypothetical protein
MNRLAVPIGRLASRKRAVMMMGAMTAPRCPIAFRLADP